MSVEHQPEIGPKPEIAKEQEYFDVAERHWKRWLAETEALAEAAADKAAARALRKLSKKQIAQFSESTAVAVGRIDAEDGETLYIGRQRIRDEDGNPLPFRLWNNLDWRARWATVLSVVSLLMRLTALAAVVYAIARLGGWAGIPGLP